MWMAERRTEVLVFAQWHRNRQPRQVKRPGTAASQHIAENLIVAIA
jgi:hypothetical protein